MKKPIIFLVVCLMAGSLSGQVSIGLAVGSNLSNLDQTIDYGSNPVIQEPDKNEMKTTLGFSIGIPVEIGISKRFSFSSAFCYLQKGSGINNESNESEMVSKVSGTTTFNYLEIPIQGRYYLIRKSINAYVNLGPSFGYLLNSRYDYRITDINLLDNTTEIYELNGKLSSKDIKDSGVNRLDISLTFGAGVDYKLWKGKIFLSINYLYGLSNMMKDADLIYEGFEQYNRGFWTTLGYLIPLAQ